MPFAFALIWRESNGSVVNACRWHAEPTLTEPAGENSTPLRTCADISTIAEPVEPKGLAGFSLCPEVGRIDQVSIRDGQNFPRRQTEIPTILGVRIVGIIVFRIFVEDLDLVIEQDDLI